MTTREAIIQAMIAFYISYGTQEFMTDNYSPYQKPEEVFTGKMQNSDAMNSEIENLKIISLILKNEYIEDPEPETRQYLESVNHIIASYIASDMMTEV